MAKEVKIKIYGQEYRLRTDAKPEVIEKCANYLSETMASPRCFLKTGRKRAQTNNQ